MERLDPSQFSIDERQRIARNAHRSLGNEVSLIAWAGGALVAIVIFMFFMPAVISVAESMTTRPIVVWVLSSFGVSCAFAALYSVFVGPSLRQARELDGALKHAQQDLTKQEVDGKIKAMNTKPGN
ncbi:MAG: hypothetical protein AAF667_03865 [Pseudomonadota bacterium]